MHKKIKKVKFHFSEAEYNALRAETITRITLINQQASTAIVTIISVWAAGIGLLILTSEKEITDILSIIVLNFINAFIFLIPVFYFIPLAVKSGENMTQLVSVSAYLKVFYDYLSCKNSEDLMNWETSNYLFSFFSEKHNKKSFLIYLYNEEYTILASASYVFYIIWAWLAYNRINKLCITFVDKNIYLSVLIILGVAGIISVFVIYRESCVRNAMMNKTQYYIEKYTERAGELGVLSKKEVDLLKSRIIYGTSINNSKK